MRSPASTANEASHGGAIPGCAFTGVSQLPAHAVRNATVGGIRDARTAGIRPANAPIRIAEAMPPDHASTGITIGPALRAGVDGRGDDPGQHADDAADERRAGSTRRGTACGSGLLVAPRARRRPISERRSSTEMIMMLATPTAPTISATTPSPRKRLSNAPAAAARAVSASDGWLTLTSSGACGVGGRREQRLHRRDMVGVRAHVDRARRAGLPLALDEADVAEVPLGGRVADQSAGVDVGLQRRGRQDARDVEPLASQPDPLVGEDAVDAEPLRGDRAEHGDRLAGRPGVEPGAAREAGVERRRAGSGWWRAPAARRCR